MRIIANQLRTGWRPRIYFFITPIVAQSGMQASSDIAHPAGIAMSMAKVDVLVQLLGVDEPSQHRLKCQAYQVYIGNKSFNGNRTHYV